MGNLPIRPLGRDDPEVDFLNEAFIRRQAHEPLAQVTFELPRAIAEHAAQLSRAGVEPPDQRVRRPRVTLHDVDHARLAERRLAEHVLMMRRSR